MVAGHFDEIAERDYRVINAFADPVRDTRCLAAAHQWLASPGRMRDRAALPGILKTCVTKAEADKANELFKSDALILRTGDSVTLRGRGKAWSLGAVEIQLRRRGREQLIDYREMPYVERPASIWSPLPETINPGPSIDAKAILLAVLRV